MLLLLGPVPLPCSCHAGARGFGASLPRRPAREIGNIATNIGGVAQATRRTTTALAEADTTVAELSRLASELQTVVGRFRV